MLLLEKVAQTVQAPSPDKAYTIFLGITVEPVVGVVLVEEVQVLVSRVVQTVLDADIIEERPITVIVVRALGDHTTHRQFYTVVPEALCELERVVSTGISLAVETVLHIERHIDGAQGLTCDL